MKILVSVKRVIDPYVKIRVKADKTGVETQNVKMTMNPFDEIAVEEAVRLMEQKIASEIIAVTIGNDASQEVLRHALALGASKAILVRANQFFCSLNIAEILHQIVYNEEVDLVLMGKQSIDGDNNQTPQMLAALLNWPQAMFASRILVKNKELEVTREIDGGLETLSLPLPAVVSSDLRLNEPRYASLPNIMKAKNKPLTILDYNSMNLNLTDHIQVLEVLPPPSREAGIKVSSVDELINKLKHEARVL